MATKLKGLALAAITFSVLLFGCKDDDAPAPDLSSSKITFDWDFTPSASATFYAVVSDTSGNVLKWDQIVPGTQLDLPYPPNGNLATVTLIVRAVLQQGRVTLLHTFTGLQPGTYTLKPDPSVEYPEKDGTFKFGLINPSADFEFIRQHMTGNYEYTDVTTKDTDYTYNYGVYDDQTNNFFAWGSTDPSHEVIKYKYFTDVNAGDSLGMSKESFDSDFETMPFHNITYPDLSNAVSADFYVTGITVDDIHIDIDAREFLASSSAKIAYPEIADLFPKYQTLMTAFDNDGNTHYEKKTKTTPDLSFANLDAQVEKIYKITTKRLAVDLSGGGDIVYLEQQFGNSADPVLYYVYAPATQKVRMTLPTFPEDLVQKVSNLSKLDKEQAFELLYVDEYNMSYPDFFDFYLDNDLFGYPPNMRSKGFFNSSAARISLDGNKTPKRFSAKKIELYAR